MQRRANKRGDYRYIILSLLLGIMILAIFLYWVYGEYFFNESDADAQICRQSVEIRGNIPNLDVHIGLVEFKDKFPLKCTTQVITVDYEDVPRLEKEIANTIAGCWNLFGEGKYTLFPSFTFGSYSTCVPCARIHLSPEVKDYYVSQGPQAIDIVRGLLMPFQGGTYYSYLHDGGAPFSAFVYGNGAPFNLEGAEFDVDASNKQRVRFYDRRTGKSQGTLQGIPLWDLNYDVSQVSLPQYYNPQKGDLIIFYAAATSDNDHNDNTEFSPSIPYMFYVHEKTDYSREFDDLFVDGTWLDNTQFCARFDGIPA